MKRIKIDLIMLFSFLTISIIGVLTIYSATVHDEVMYKMGYHLKQLTWIGISFIVALVMASLKPSFYQFIAYYFYYFVLFLLFVLTVTNVVSHGVNRWFVLGPIKFQPSEMAKIAIILAMSKYLVNKELGLNNTRDFIKKLLVVGVIVGVPGILILKEPDLGTALSIFALIPFFLYWKGIKALELFFIFSPIISVLISLFSIFYYNLWILWLIYFVVLILVILKFIYNKQTKYLVYFIVFLNILMGIVTQQIWNGLKKYQQDRVLTFIQPDKDVHNKGYQVRQSKIALSSGGFWGKGWLNGTQTRLKFLPEKHTDFIFATYAEQFGFVGSVFLVFLYFLFLFRILINIENTHNDFINTYAVGVSGYFIFHIFVNISMTMGLMPVTGLPLILMSYGGSALLSSFMMMGILFSAQVYKNENI